MKIVRAVACIAFVVLGSGVAVSQTQASQIVGVWNCHAQTEESVVAGVMTYNADGTMDSNVSVTAKFDEGDLVLRVVSKSSWKLVGDGLIEEAIVTATATSGSFAGKTLEASDLASFSDGVPKEAGTSTVVVTDKKLVLIDGEQTVTACTR